MRKWLSAFTLIELLVVIAIIAILAGLLLPALARAREESRRKSCNSNIGQIVKACTTYQEPNGDYFPAHWDGFNDDGGHDNQGTSSREIYEGMNNPMQSIALLYPAYVDNPKVYRCPSTNDKPAITVWYVNAARQNVFYENWDWQNGTNNDATDHDGVTLPGIELSGEDHNQNNISFVQTNVKCSYMYDCLMHFRDVGPSQGLLADADGQTWIRADGSKPLYDGPGGSWARTPRKPNHENGQNVMYFDGHVKWKETNYASDDPKDNIFCPNGNPASSTTTAGQHTNAMVGADVWGQDTDAWMGDEITGGGAMDEHMREVQPSD